MTYKRNRESPPFHAIQTVPKHFSWTWISVESRNAGSDRKIQHMESGALYVRILEAALVAANKQDPIPFTIKK